MFIQHGKVIRFFPVDAYFVTKGSELKGHESNWQEVGLAKQFIFLETSEFLPADDTKTSGNVHNYTMAGCLVFSYHLLFKHTAKRNHLSEVFTAGREEFYSVNCDKIWKHTYHCSSKSNFLPPLQICNSRNYNLFRYYYLHNFYLQILMGSEAEQVIQDYRS